MKLKCYQNGIKTISLIILILLSSCKNQNYLSDNDSVFANNTYAFAKDSIYTEIYFNDSTMFFYSSGIGLYFVLPYMFDDSSINIVFRPDAYYDEGSIIENIEIGSDGFYGYYSKKRFFFHKVDSAEFTINKVIHRDTTSQQRFNKEYRQRELEFAKKYSNIDTFYHGRVLRLQDSILQLGAE